jgi:UDP-2,3-diacylglucosamine pyrophosphatase LpxH
MKISIMETKQVEALFISDVHLGSKGSNADKLLETLKQYKPKYLFIVGDFIDGWLLKKRHYWTQDYTNVIRKILSYSKRGTKVIYITGNHDDFLRHYTPTDLGLNILIVDEYIWKDYYITHGDLYDGVVNLKWLAHLGSFGYELAIGIDRLMKKLGYKKSLSKWAKDSVKQAVKFITSFEDQLAYQAHKRNCKGVICGHIHKPEDKMIDNIHYLNCGDWIENNTYIIYDNKSESFTTHNTK